MGLKNEVEIISPLHNIIGLEHIHPGSIYTLKTMNEKKQVIILAEFKDNEDVREIIGKVHTLMETNLIIERNLSKEERDRKNTFLMENSFKDLKRAIEKCPSKLW